MTWGDFDLTKWVRDVTIPIFRRKVICRYEGCTTILNQDNVKDQIFCYVHQRKITFIISEGIKNPQYHKYYKLYYKHRKALLRKEHMSLTKKLKKPNDPTNENDSSKEIKKDG